MKYEDMSDFEVNRKVVELMHNPSEPYCIVHNGVWHKSIGHIIGSLPDGAFKFVNDDRWWVPFPDYCNNPSDAWGIIELVWERLMQVDAYYQAHTRWEAYCIEHGVGKLRAAMICFLKMKDAQQ